MVSVICVKLQGLFINCGLGVPYTSKREKIKAMRGKPLKKSREWIKEKKDRRKRQGKETRTDSKYTGRKRSGRF